MSEGHDWTACATCAEGCWICHSCGAEGKGETDDVREIDGDENCEPLP